MVFSDPSGTLAMREAGMFCVPGGFYVDPWWPVEKAVITHAHSDHARAGSQRYLCATPGRGVLAHRMQEGAAIDTLDYGVTQRIGEVTLSFHPSGHLLGSAQVRLEHKGHVTVITGDYKVESDPTCAAFEVVPCDHFITECTFGLPIYRWEANDVLAAQINAWWRGNAERGVNSVVYAYALGKAQRVLAMLDETIGPILEHGAVHALTKVYREGGVTLPATAYADKDTVKAANGRAMVIAVPSANGTPWMKKLQPVSTAMASGWMQVRGRRRFRAVDRGFVVSDHADWNGLLDTIQATGATRVCCTHGSTDVLSRYLREERGVDAYELATHARDSIEDEAG